MNSDIRKSIFLLAMLLIALADCASGESTLENPEPAPSEGETSGSSSYSQPLVPASGEVIEPSSFEYLGAFRLPGGEERPETFEYGGNAMTFNPDGDPSGATDGSPGSLFMTGHDRIAYGDLPDGSQVAEISIPQPVVSRNIEDLNTAEFLQDFHNVLEGYFTNLEEIPRIGMAYLNRPETGPKIHFTWGQHLQEPGDPTHGWFNANLDAPDVEGFWYIGQQDPYSLTGYMFTIPH